MILLDFGLKFEREILGRIGLCLRKEEEVLLVISEEEQNLGR